jgi:hypothetical protein
VVLSTGISIAPPDLQPAWADDDVRALNHYSKALDFGPLTSLCCLTSSLLHAHRLACQLHRSALLQVTAAKPVSPERKHLSSLHMARPFCHPCTLPTHDRWITWLAGARMH